MKKLSAAHQQAVTERDAAYQERFAYHRILTASLHKDLHRVGSVYDAGDSYVWLIAFSPRFHVAFILETFQPAQGTESIRCFQLQDAASAYQNQSFDSTDVRSKLQALYFRACDMEQVEQNRTHVAQIAHSISGFCPTGDELRAEYDAASPEDRAKLDRLPLVTESDLK
jgi:hypothetical protein